MNVTPAEPAVEIHCVLVRLLGGHWFVASLTMRAHIRQGRSTTSRSANRCRAVRNPDCPMQPRHSRIPTGRILKSEMRPSLHLAFLQARSESSPVREQLLMSRCRGLAPDVIAALITSF